MTDISPDQPLKIERFAWGSDICQLLVTLNAALSYRLTPSLIEIHYR